MFVANCPDHGPTLVWTSQIDAIDNLPDRIAVRFHFSCGRPAVLETGRPEAA